MSVQGARGDGAKLAEAGRAGMIIDYRDAGAADGPVIGLLFRDSFVDTFGHLYSPENLARFLAEASDASFAEELAQPAYAARIAEVDGVAVGFVKLGPITLPVTPEGPAIEFRQLYVRPDWKGSGVAAPLTRWALAEAKGRGAAELYLSVYTDNQRARRFYARYGFEAVGSYAFMVGDHEDEDIIMRLRL